MFWSSLEDNPAKEARLDHGGRLSRWRGYNGLFTVLEGSRVGWEGEERFLVRSAIADSGFAEEAGFCCFDTSYYS